MTSTAPASSAARTDVDRLSAIAEQVRGLREDIEHAVEGAGAWDEVHPDHAASARNLVQYLKLRQHDVRELQVALADLGLSSLGRLEAHVGPAIAAVDRAIRRQLYGPDASASATELDTDATASMLDRNADRLLGKPRDGRRTRILVTMPSEAATDRVLVDRIVRSGIEAVRINCAHDNPDAWRRMIDNLRAVERARGVSVKILMDLAGPKLRTGPIASGPEVVKVKPTRDSGGRVTAPAYIWLSASTPAPDDAVPIPIDDVEWLTELRVGEEIRCIDARGSKRRLRVVRTGDGGVLAEVPRTCYFATGMGLRSEREERADVGVLPATEQKIALRSRDLIHLVPDLTPVEPARDGLRIGCTLPAVFTDVQPGERVYFDDGKIGGVVESAAPDDIAVRIDDIAPTGAKLAAEKGINLPDTVLNLPALTDDDLTNLDFAAEYADVVSLSFVRTADDVALLQRELHQRGADDLGVVLKIETVAGIDNLPEILLQALRSQQVGVMIARGDLAIEAGYERLAEVQEEIMWLCEAAHIPAIWATQVLDTLAKTGRPSRAEVTDAAMSGRAECVMLNKGPYVANAVRLLTAILQRMAEHHTKKRTLMRRIVAWTPATGA